MRLVCPAAQTEGVLRCNLVRFKEKPVSSHPAEAVPANRLLAALPAGDRKRMLAACERVDLVFDQVLAQPGLRLAHAWFPLDAILSVGMGAAPREQRLEVALVGWEGMVGLPLLLGAAASSLRATVVRAGAALRILPDDLRAQLLASQALRELMQRYVLVSITHLAQTALCTRHHHVEQRLARWLLMAQDRVLQGGFHATHEMLAATLGVRRAGITRAATDLQGRQLIAYRRGEVAVLDRIGLQAAACNCYATDCASHVKLMRAPSAR